MPAPHPARHPSPRRAFLAGLTLAFFGLLASPAGAEKADRSRPMTLESDKPCTVNLLRQTSLCSGNVTLAQGSLLIRAEKLELRETPEGYQFATLSGTNGQNAQFRQKRDNLDEFVEGSAQLIVYDGKTGTVRFEGQARVSRLRGGQALDEITGRIIVWDSVGEQFSVEGGAVSPSNPGGRVRAVIAPREPAASTPGAQR